MKDRLSFGAIYTDLFSFLEQSFVVFFLVFVLATVAGFLAMGTPSGVFDLFSGRLSVFLLFGVFAFLVAIFIYFLRLQMIYKALGGCEDSIPTGSVFLRYILAGTLWFLILVPSFFLFVVPGVYLLLRTMFFPYFLIDGFGAIDSLKASWRLTYGFTGKIFLILLLPFLLALIVGVLGALSQTHAVGFALLSALVNSVLLVPQTAMYMRLKV